MVKHFVEIDPRVFLDGTRTARRIVQLTGPGTRKKPGISLESPCAYAGPKTTSHTTGAPERLTKKSAWLGGQGDPRTPCHA